MINKMVRGILAMAVIGGALGLPGRVVAQILGRDTNGNPVILNNNDNFERIDTLQYIAVNAYIDSSDILAGTVEKFTEKKLVDYFIPTLSVGAEAGLQAALKGSVDKNGLKGEISGTAGAKATLTATFDFKPPRKTTENYNLQWDRFVDAYYKNAKNAKIIEAVVMGLGQVGPGELNIRTGNVQNKGELVDLFVYEYGNVENFEGGKIGMASIGFSGVDIVNHAGLTITDFDDNHRLINSSIDRVARLVNNGDIAVAAVEHGGYLSNTGGNDAYISLLHTKGGSVINQEGAEIDGALISGGIVTNRSNAIINTAILKGGTLNNVDGIVENVFVEWGGISNIGDESKGTIKNVTINNDGILSNRGSIANVILNEGELYNYNSGNIQNAKLNNNSTIFNGGRIEFLTYNSGDLLTTINTSSYSNQNPRDYTNSNARGTIGELTIYGDSHGIDWGNVDEVNINAFYRPLFLYSYDYGTMDNTSHIGKVTVGDGSINNRDNGYVEAAYVNGEGSDYGKFFNRDNSYTGTATVNSYGSFVNQDSSRTKIAFVNRGTLGNYDNAIIESLTLNDGTVYNTSQIIDLIYTGGIYKNYVPDSNQSGTIGTLTIDGWSLGIDWGNVGTLNVKRGSLDSYVMNSGDMVNNGSWIENLHYTAGIYNRTLNGVSGAVGHLTIDGIATDIEWGNLHYVTVKENGRLNNNAIITEMATVDGGEMHNFNRGNSIIETLDILSGKFVNYGDSIDGNPIDATKNGIVNHANVSGGILENGGGIYNATVSGGTLRNNGDGIIEKAEMNGGIFNNNGRTNELTYNGGTYGQSDFGIADNHFIVGASERIGTLLNNGAITQATVNDGGAMYNRHNGNSANSYVETLDLFGGYFENGGDLIVGNAIDQTINGVVDNANVHGGTLVNGGGIHNATISGGILQNNFDGIVEKAELNIGGTFNNNGRTDELTYNGGTYKQTDSGIADNHFIVGENERIGTLNNNNTIPNVTVNNGKLYNGQGGNGTPSLLPSLKGFNGSDSTGTIETLFVNGGEVYNGIGGDGSNGNLLGNGGHGGEGTGSIGTVHLIGGVLQNGINGDGGTDYKLWDVLGGSTNIGGEGGIGIGTIGTANVDGGILNNDGTIDVVTQNLGTINNAGSIGTMSYYDGTFNGADGKITTLNIFGDATSIDWGNVGTTNVENGTIANASGNTIAEATLENGGKLVNSDGTVTSATVNENAELVNDGGTVTTAALNGGSISNMSRIENLSYAGGTYESSFGDSTGTIGTLTAAQDLSLNDGNWGSVENLKFDSKGDGILRVTAFIEDPMETASFASIQAAKATVSDIKFDGVKVQDSIDFTDGNIVLTMSDDFVMTGNDLIGSFMDAFGFTDGFNLADLLVQIFAVSEVSNEDDLNSFEVAFDYPDGVASFWLIANGQFGAEWTFNEETGYVTWADPSSDGNGVPEPATLLILGLGLTGLGLARRRRK